MNATVTPIIISTSICLFFFKNGPQTTDQVLEAAFNAVKFQLAEGIGQFSAIHCSETICFLGENKGRNLKIHI